MPAGPTIAGPSKAPPFRIPELRGKPTRGIFWPQRSRRFVVATDLATGTGTRFGVGEVGSAVVPMGSYGGDIEISYDQRHWFPLNPGSAWPVYAPTKRGPAVFLRRNSTGYGTLILAIYDDYETAKAAAQFVGGATPQNVAGAGVAPVLGVNVIIAVQAGVSANVVPVLSATNIGTLVTNRGTGAGVVYIGKSGQGTTALGAQIPVGQSLMLYGALEYATDAAQTIEFLEYLA